jgi:hypothetical protein
MNSGLNHIERSIFGRTDVEKVSLEELDFLVTEYPYFPVIHFLRTRKLLADNIPPTSNAITRTSLYFHSPHWLYHQVYKIELPEPHDEPFSEILHTPSFADELAFIIPDETTIPETELKLEESAMKFDEKRIFHEHETFVTEEITYEDLPIKEIALEELISTDVPMEYLPTVEISNGVIEDSEISVLEPEEMPIQREEIISVEIPEEQLVSSEIQKDQPVPEEVLNIPLEPLYSIDYFASQGIKLHLDEQQDQLSKKLRSFTEWLKAMKKIHPEKLDQKMDKEQEKNIRDYAETSNEQHDLYTEALAEVYLKQGLHQKAASVFEKLSLLDPSKSAYFAARIREIKEN